ncbi:MAG: energy-coupling factor transporter transmembrane protein EcfT [Clostridia bacterium]|nr:energy-coupling factor transporter transmembrane protein EcfT [Clostridia bacterium]
MLKDMSLGQFYPGDSLLHKTDGRIKIILLLLFMVITLASSELMSMIFVALITLALVISSGIPFKMVLKNLKPLSVIVLFTAVLNLFFIKGDHLLFSWKFISVYREGAVFAAFMVARLLCLVTGSFIIISYTTSPLDLTDSLESLLSPLKKIKVPVHEFAMIMTIALRFIPTLLEETDRIISAQKARGADLESGNLLKRIKALVPVLIPLFVSSFRRADELAEAMECRCYKGGEGRTRMKIRKTAARDYIILVFSLLMCAGIFFVNAYNDEIVGLGVRIWQKLF